MENPPNDNACNTITVSLKQFLTISTCPNEWLAYDLYLFREDDLVFYIGQSELAFARVWRHLHAGFKGRSLIGKFIRANWPRSMNFAVTFYASSDYIGPDSAFVNEHQDRLAIEAYLIDTLHPCLNAALNAEPTPLPAAYAPPTKNVRFPRHIGRMIREAEVAWQQVQNMTEW